MHRILFHTAKEMEMKYLVGIATHTGENIDIHFGHCKEFQIIEVTDNESFDAVDVIDAGRACDGTCDHKEIARVGELLKGCKYVLSAKIGPGAAKILRDLGIVALEIEAPVDYAIDRIMAYDRRQMQANRG
jgi:predicted Fe-Mo cluster-binding NifX family protein